jgi:hypothetical protein
LTHIDGTLRVLATDLDPEKIRPKRVYRRNRYFAHNELSRLCLGVLRTAAGEPLSTDDIAGRVIAAKGFDQADAILRAAIREQIGSTVKRLHRGESHWYHSSRLATNSGRRESNSSAEHRLGRRARLPA